MEEQNGLMSPEQRQREISEAIAAGEASLDFLKKVYDQLGSAGNWGFWDMIGGGAVSSLVKHSKIKDAQGNMEEARRRLSAFRKEVADVSEFPDFQIEVGGFLEFVDIVLDNIFVDWAVQSKIQKAEEDVYAAMQQVRAMLGKLRAL